MYAEIVSRLKLSAFAFSALVAASVPLAAAGVAKALGGDRIPNQLMVKFASNKFKNVKVGQVNITKSGSNDWYFLVLEE